MPETPPPRLTVDQQFHALTILDLLTDLFIASPKTNHTTAEVLWLFSDLRQNHELIDADVLAAYQDTMRRHCPPPDPTAKR